MREWNTSYQHAQYWQGNNTKNHGELCAEPRCNICKETGEKLDTKHRCEHVPNLVETGHEGKVTILWNQQVRTDRTIPNSEPDSVMCDNGQGTCMF